MKAPVFHSYGKWYLSGVNTWTVNLIHAMQRTEFDSKVLFTGIPDSPQPELDAQGIDYKFLDLPFPRKRQQEWRALKKFLEASSPCIYITNFDFHRSCAVGTFSSGVRVIAVVHSDEECYYDEIRRVGRNCDVIICVSRFLSHKVRKFFPHLADRVRFIPYGVPIPEKPSPPRPSIGQLRLCYCNRLQQYQKRVFDLPLIATELEKLDVNYELTIAGDGPDGDELRERFRDANLKAPIRFLGRIPSVDVLKLCRKSHLFLLTSDFEGLPISLLEAMSVGCVPIVYGIESGISDAIPNTDYGYTVPHGDTIEYAKVIKSMSKKLDSWQEMSAKCTRIIAEKFSLKRMADDYDAVFKSALKSKFSLNRDRRVSVPCDLSFRGRALKRLKKFSPTLPFGEDRAARY